MTGPGRATGRQPAAPLPAGEVGLGPRPWASPAPAPLLRLAFAAYRHGRALFERLCPPDLLVMLRGFGVVDTVVAGVLVRYHIPDHLATRPQRADELAGALGLVADPLHRVLRVAAYHGALRLDGDGRFRNGPLAEALRAGRPSRKREWAAYFASAANLRAYQALDLALRGEGPGHVPFDRANGAGIWAHFDAHPDERETFAQLMMGLTIADAPGIATRYPWREVGLVCDVGGGRGTLLSELLVRHQHLRGMLVDGAGVIESARGLLAARGVGERAELVAGDFFRAVPAGADAYLLKHVLHDWDDVDCRRILTTVRAAASAGARVVLAESMVEPNELTPAVLSDLHMMVVCGGRERSLGQLRVLLEATGFALGRVWRAPTTSIIEGVAR